MISIIICSQNPEYLKALTANIEATIGTVYEILAFDNTLVKKGIAAVYNSQAAKANYNIICFMHEDVVMHTHGWGTILNKLLANKSIGLVGISGAVYKSKYAGTWSTCHSSLYRTNSIQHFENSERPVVTNINPENADYATVAVIDGVFMATRKDVFSKNLFDETLLKGFHGYDIDYSIQVGQQYKLVVSYAFLLEHFSEGKLSEQWLRDSLTIHKKWEKRLPGKAIDLNKEEEHYNDYLAVKSLLSAALKITGNKQLVLSNYLRLLFIFRKYNRYQFLKSVLKYFFKEILCL